MFYSSEWTGQSFVKICPSSVAGSIALPFRALFDVTLPPPLIPVLAKQPVNAIGRVLSRNLVTETRRLGFIGDVGGVRRDAETQRQAGGLAQMPGFRYAAGGRIAMAQLAATN
jgi:hypothetical protein